MSRIPRLVRPQKPMYSPSVISQVILTPSELVLLYSKTQLREEDEAIKCLACQAFKNGFHAALRGHHALPEYAVDQAEMLSYDTRRWLMSQYEMGLEQGDLYHQRQQCLYHGSHPTKTFSPPRSKPINVAK